MLSHGKSSWKVRRIKASTKLVLALLILWWNTSIGRIKVGREILKCSFVHRFLVFSLWAFSLRWSLASKIKPKMWLSWNRKWKRSQRIWKERKKVEMQWWTHMRDNRRCPRKGGRPHGAYWVIWSGQTWCALPAPHFFSFQANSSSSLIGKSGSGKNI